MRPLTVAVFGASGVLGRPLVAALTAAGHVVRPAARGLNGIDLLSSDLRPVVAGCDAVVHAATAIPRDQRAPGAWDLNTRLRTDGTRRLLDACQAAGVQRYVQQSITMAYADGGDRWLDESTPFDDQPRRASVVGPIRLMESHVQASGLEWTILRGGAFVGPGTAQDDEIIGLQAGSLSIPCEGQYWLSSIHPGDFARAIVATLAHASPPRILNITAEPLRFADYIAALAHLVQAPPPAHTTGRCPASQRVTSAAARAALGWHPQHSIWPMRLPVAD